MVRELLPNTTQKAVRVLATGGQQITLDAHDLEIEGQWIEVDLTLKVDFAGERLLEPSIQILNLFLGDRTTQQLRFISPEDLQVVVRAESAPTPPTATERSSAVTARVRPTGTRGVPIRGSIRVGPGA